MTNKHLANLRARMNNHKVVDDQAIVELYALELDGLLSCIDKLSTAIEIIYDANRNNLNTHMMNDIIEEARKLIPQ